MIRDFFLFHSIISHLWQWCRLDQFIHTLLMDGQDTRRIHQASQAALYWIRSLIHSGQKSSCPSAMNPFPRREVLHPLHPKHSECQCLPSKAMNFDPEIPEFQNGWNFWFKIWFLEFYFSFPLGNHDDDWHDHIMVMKEPTVSPNSLPAMGLVQTQHLLAKTVVKHSIQHGWLSFEVNFCPANWVEQFMQVKHSLCQCSLRYVTPPVEMAWFADHCRHRKVSHQRKYSGIQKKDF